MNESAHLPLACGCPDGNGSVRLPFLARPPIQTYNYAAFTLGSVLAHAGMAPGFLVNNYIELTSPAPYSRKHLLAFLPAIGINDAPAFSVGEGHDWPIPYPACAPGRIRAALAEGYFARFCGDEYHVPSTPNFQRRHFVHDNLVYGYCPRCDAFSTAGYRSQKGIARFAASPCPPEALAKSLQPVPGLADPYQSILALFRPRGPGDPVNVEGIAHSLRSYLGDPAIAPSVHSNLPASSSAFCTGIKVYAALSRALSPVGAVDLRAFRLLWEHKKIMSLRVQALIDIGYLDSQLQAAARIVEEDTHSLFLLLVRSKDDVQTRNVPQLLETLENVKAREVSLLSSCLAKLSAVSCRASCAAS